MIKIIIQISIFSVIVIIRMDECKSEFYSSDTALMEQDEKSAIHSKWIINQVKKYFR